MIQTHIGSLLCLGRGDGPRKHTQQQDVEGKRGRSGGPTPIGFEDERKGKFPARRLICANLVRLVDCMFKSRF